MAIDEHLQTVRHSCAHVMAEAILKLYPGTKIAIGPAIENGFYYDFEFPTDTKFTETDFATVEKEMRRILAGNHEFVRKEISKEEALKLFADQPYKIELINDLPEGETISTYEQDGYLDLCRGPHVASTKEINGQAFKLDRVAGAYWRGDSNRTMLTRVYALCFEKPNDLKDYLAMMAEAEKRDHRKLGQEMDLFHLDPEDPGQIFWHPNGWTIYTVMQDYMRKMIRRDGYQEVNTPAIMPRTLWERSGHWGHYQQNMFITESEKRMFAIKPMNCPGALEIFKSRQRSYKDLPLRLAEFGHDVRNEASGTLHGVMRVRGFVQDDAHILCTEEQIGPEVAKFCKLLKQVYHDFGFNDLVVKFSTMPEDHVGDLATWERAEKGLADACHEAGLEYEIQPGEGAFYGPKLEFKLYDCIGREWQCGTIQVDYQLPSAERLDATYIGADNQKHHPVMLHRAILGSFERFLGILIENFAGNFPTWLAFEQAAIVPVSNDFDDYAKKVYESLIGEDIRANAYLSNDNMRNKIKTITKEHKTPYILIVGENEQKEGTVTVRFRQNSGLEQKTMKIEEFIAYVQKKNEEKGTDI
ncbi:MAG: threonine--tRNA ligase [Treponema sp.]|nr:threonine--tRNA ligase [Spirochaetia bacterium]MDD7535218.1 threonine--tRNA ligase [Treponema sp.]MDY3721123.1 threonine--tRNA ligase [Treponema sp.]MDY5757985.1 threonine--tRNA ligase [Treponema sp.]MDY5818130.1 threonine--tRNA ligase [Treponema sp.]